MKFSRHFRRRRKNPEPSTRTDGESERGADSIEVRVAIPRTTTEPRIEALRPDEPVQMIDLSTDGFRGNFPKLAQRMADRTSGHKRRRTAEQAAVKPPDASGEETNDT